LRVKPQVTCKTLPKVGLPDAVLCMRGGWACAREERLRADEPPPLKAERVAAVMRGKRCAQKRRLQEQTLRDTSP